MQKANTSMEPWQMSIIGGQDKPSGILSYLHIRSVPMEWEDKGMLMDMIARFPRAGLP